MVKDGYKQTDIGLIPEDWSIIDFEDISTMNGRIGWQGLKQEEFTFTYDEPFLITGMNFKDGKIRWDEVYHVSEERYKQAKQIQLKTNDILMTKDGTIGKLLYVDNIPFPKKASLNSHLLVFRPKNNTYNPKFMFYQLHGKHFLQHIELTKSGSTFFGISQETMGKYKAILPPIEEQKAIANALSDTDELINSLEKFISKKEAIKQGTMQQLLTGKKRLNGFSGDWEEKRLGDVIVKFQNGFAFNAKGYIKNGMPIITMAQIGLDGTFKFDTNKVNYWNLEESKNLKDFYLNNGDVIIAMTDVTPEKNLIGRMTIVNTSSTCLLNQRVGHLILDEKQINPLFLTTISNMKKWRAYSIGIASLGVQANIGTKDILNGLIKLPSIKEQNAIAEILSDMDNEIETLKSKLSKTKAIKDGIMSELLTGKIRLKVKDE